MLFSLLKKKKLPNVLSHCKFEVAFNFSSENLFYRFNKICEKAPNGEPAQACLFGNTSSEQYR